MLYVLFGEMGVGKNYIGERLAHILGCDFYDGDLSMPSDMREKVNNLGFLSDEMLTRFVSVNLIRDIRDRMQGLSPFVASNVEDLVVAQALYKEKYRQMVWNAFPDATLVYIVPPSLRVHLSRIMSRPRGLRWAMYLLMSKPFFQKPPHGTDIIVNDTDESIDEQIVYLFVKVGNRIASR